MAALVILVQSLQIFLKISSDLFINLFSTMNMQSTLLKIQKLQPCKGFKKQKICEKLIQNHDVIIILGGLLAIQ